MLPGERVLWFSGAAMRLVILTLFVWKNTGFYVVILSARLSGTPKEQLEAAQLDGANFPPVLLRVSSAPVADDRLFGRDVHHAGAGYIPRVLSVLRQLSLARDLYATAFYLQLLSPGDYNSAVTALYALLPVIALMVWGLLREGSHEKS